MENSGSLVLGSTREMYREPGSPLSRAKAHVILEAAASTAIPQAILIDNTTADKAVAPAVERLYLLKISIN